MTAEAGSPRPGTARILVVDDDRGLTRILRTMLEFDGYAVQEAGSTAGLLERIASSIPDLVILDYHMPEMSGLDVLAAIRQKLGDTIPVIMLTGESENLDVAVRSLKQGAMDYLVKPVAMDRLLAAVRTALRVQRLRNDLRRVTADHATLWALLPPALIVGEDGCVRRMNPAAETLLGRKIDACEGRPLAEVLGMELPAAQLPGNLAETQAALHGGGALTGRSVPLASNETLILLATPDAPAPVPRAAARPAPAAGGKGSRSGPVGRSRPAPGKSRG